MEGNVAGSRREGTGREGGRKKVLRIRMPYSQHLIKSSHLKHVKCSKCITFLKSYFLKN